MAIDLGPLRPSRPGDGAGDGGTGAAAGGGGRRPGLFRRAARGVGWLGAGPADWFGRREVRSGGAAIGELARALRSGGSGRGPFLTFADGTFDLEGTAEALGIGVDALRGLLAERRRQTARAAWGLWALGLVFLGAWLWQALAMEVTAARLASLLWFLPFVVLFALLGALQALTNFQIREGRAVGWREWIATEGRFWPC